MPLYDVITSDISLETFRALVVTGLFLFTYLHGHKTSQHVNKGWPWVLGGFGLLMFASILDVTDNFDSLNVFIVIGDTHGQAILEKVVGYLGGFFCLFIGFWQWLPIIAKDTQTEEHLKLLESQQRYRDLVDLSPDGIILHRDNKIIYANAAAARLVCITDPSLLVGRMITEFIHPAYQAQTRERMRALDEGLNKVPLVHLKLLCDNCDSVDVEVASGITEFQGEPAMQSVLRDATKRMRAERALQESERELRSIFDNMAEFYYRANLEGVIVRASGAAEELTGWTQEQIIGLKLADRYVDPKGRDKFLKALKESDGRVRNFEAQLMRERGDRIWVSTNAQYYYDETGAVAGVEGTVRNITEQVQAREVLEHMAMHDMLTGLPNRRNFESRLNEALARARRHKVGGALLYFDLDGFKSVNDSHGHDLGDDVLREVGRRLRDIARETDFAARIGGDEFCLLIEDAADDTAAKRVAEKIITSISDSYPIGQKDIHLGVSIGIAPFDGTETGERKNLLITDADKAMYQAKQDGGNAYRFISQIFN